MINTLFGQNHFIDSANLQPLLGVWINTTHTALGWGLFLTAVVLTIVLGVLTYWRFHKEIDARLDNTHFMFRELCRAHDLSGPQCQLLHRLALGLKLSNPSALFVDSSLWQIPEDRPGRRELTKKEWDRLQVIRRVLFTPAIANPY